MGDKLLAVFDILIYEGKDVSMKNLKERLGYLKKFVGKVGKGDIDIVLKKFEFKDGKDIYKLNEAIFKEKRKYKIDGLIFTPVNAPYKVKPSKTFK